MNLVIGQEADPQILATNRDPAEVVFADEVDG